MSPDPTLSHTRPPTHPFSLPPSSLLSPSLSAPSLVTVLALSGALASWLSQLLLRLHLADKVFDIRNFNKSFVYKSQNFNSMLSRLLLNEIIISADVISLFLNKDYFISLVLRDSIFKIKRSFNPKSKVLFWKLSK